MHPTATKSTVGRLPCVRAVSLAAAVGLAYFVVAYLSLSGMFFLESEGITLFWAAAGVSSGVLIAVRSSARWSVVVGIFAAAFAIPFFVLERGIWLATVFAVCDIAEPMIIAGLIAHYFGSDFALDHLHRVLGLIGATLAGTAPSSLAAAVASRLFLGPAAPILTTWLHWWAGVAIGVVAVAPLIIGWAAAMREPPPRSEQIEGAVGLLALTGMTGVVIALPQQLWETVVPGALLFPILLWLAARCRPVFAAGGALVVSLALTWTTTFGIGHLGDKGLPVGYRIMQAQAIILLVTIGSQTLAALFAERRASAALEARLSERTRIARELHDTLLQSFQGLLLRFRTVHSLSSTRPAEAQRMLEAAIDEARKAITEGRQAVQGLRSSVIETYDFTEAIRVLGEELGSDPVHGRSVEVPLTIEGTPCELQPLVRDELYRIASEAMRNAFRHAEASRIEVQLRYGERRFELRVRDNGKGIDPQFLSNRELPGHYGLRGMRERCKVIGGKLTIWSASASGTGLEVIVPGARAYGTTRARYRFWLTEGFSATRTPHQS